MSKHKRGRPPDSSKRDAIADAVMVRLLATEAAVRKSNLEKIASKSDKERRELTAEEVALIEEQNKPKFGLLARVQTKVATELKVTHSYVEKVVAPKHRDEIKHRWVRNIVAGLNSRDKATEQKREEEAVRFCAEHGIRIEKKVPH